MKKQHSHTPVLSSVEGTLVPITPKERDLGKQPIAQIMRDLELNSHDLVANSTEQLTHKMVKRACKGRRLSSNVKTKIRNAINLKTGKNYAMQELFNY